MQNINVQLYSILRDKLPKESKGRALIALNDEAALQDLLDKLDITRRVTVSVNGVHILEYSHPLQDGDEVKIFSSVSGG